MLIVTRKPGEKIYIGTDRIITLFSIDGWKAHLRFTDLRDGVSKFPKDMVLDKSAVVNPWEDVTIKVMEVGKIRAKLGVQADGLPIHREELLRRIQDGGGDLMCVKDKEKNYNHAVS